VIVHSVGFEPTQSKLLELESSPLDRSGMNAYTTRYKIMYKYKIFGSLERYLVPNTITVVLRKYGTPVREMRNEPLEASLLLRTGSTTSTNNAGI
jgi:hypothetical protein